MARSLTFLRQVRLRTDADNLSPTSYAFRGKRGVRVRAEAGASSPLGHGQPNRNLVKLARSPVQLHARLIKLGTAAEIDFGGVGRCPGCDLEWRRRSACVLASGLGRRRAHCCIG